MNTGVHHVIPLLAVAALTLAGCASSPERSADLERARAAITQVASMPDASTAAGVQLKEAQDTLSHAEEAAASRAPYDEVAHLAYVAQLQARIAEAKIREVHAQKRVEGAAADRNAALLDAREREAAEAQQRAAAAESSAAEAWRQVEEAKQTDRGIVLTLGDVLFDTGRAELKPGAQLILDRLAAYMSDNPSTRIIIEGHTDSTGSDETNRMLSEQRAEAVAMSLRSRGIPTDRLETVGLGEAYPIATNNTSAGREQNRRVEVVLSDETGTFRDSAHRTASNYYRDPHRSSN
jgi:outer membrane protein OmpA-like peptidoglycan-associated protein